MKVKDIDINNKYTTFSMMLSIKKNFDRNNIKIDETSYNNILIYYIGYVTIKDSKYITLYINI